MEKNKTKLKHYHPVIGVLVLLLIAAAVAWYMNRPTTETGVEDATTLVNHDAAVTPPDEPDAETVPKLKNRVVVSDQQAGSSVIIDEVGLQDPGYVVIHENANGQPGKIVAQSGLISAGNKQDLIIRYSVTPGTTYFAMLHSDNGDGKFNSTTDLPIPSAQTTPVMMMFSVVR